MPSISNTKPLYLGGAVFSWTRCIKTPPIMPKMTKYCFVFFASTSLQYNQQDHQLLLLTETLPRLCPWTTLGPPDELTSVERKRQICSIRPHKRPVLTMFLCGCMEQIAPFLSNPITNPTMMTLKMMITSHNRAKRDCGLWRQSEYLQGAGNRDYCAVATEGVSKRNPCWPGWRPAGGRGQCVYACHRALESSMAQTDGQTLPIFII